jgi:hypothetical protein
MLLTFIQDTFKFYKQNLWFLVSIMLPIIVPLEIFNAVIQVYWQADPENTQFLIITSTVALITYPIYQAALVIGISNALDGRYIPATKLWKDGVKFWIPLLVINLVYYVGVFLGLMILILPGIYIAVRWTLAEQSVILDGDNPLEAFRSSFNDTSDQFWVLLQGMFTIGLGVLVVGLSFSSVVGNLTGNSPVIMIIPAVIQSMFYPLFVIFLLRVRHYINHKE